MSVSVLENRASIVWNRLNGLFCVYKPADVKVEQVRHTIITKLSAELNELECRPPMDYVSIEGDPKGRMEVVVRPNLADDPLVVGPRYQTDDIKCSWSNYLGFHTSGVLLFGIRSGTKIAKRIRENYAARSYLIRGTLGQATENCYKDGKIVERSTFRHVRQAYLDSFLRNMQAAHQRKMFELCGVDIQSQAAYELAVKGLLRPANSEIPIIYGIKCVEFDSPNFTLEIQCINEYEMYLKLLIHEIGVKMHSTAHCTGIQCIRHGVFTLDHALLRKHWTLQNIVSSIEECTKILEENDYLLEQEGASLVKN